MPLPFCQVSYWKSLSWKLPDCGKRWRTWWKTMKYWSLPPPLANLLKWQVWARKEWLVSLCWFTCLGRTGFVCVGRGNYMWAGGSRSLEKKPLEMLNQTLVEQAHFCSVLLVGKSKQTVWVCVFHKLLIAMVSNEGGSEDQAQQCSGPPAYLTSFDNPKENKCLVSKSNPPLLTLTCHPPLNWHPLPSIPSV